jgi:putative DNA primase/helicase
MVSADASLDFAALERGSHRLRCPECGRSDRDRTMGVTVERDRTVWHCYRCGEAGAKRHGRTLYHRPPQQRAAAQPQRYPTLAAHWRDTWNSLLPVHASPVAAYLKARCCDLPKAHVRYARALRHPSGYVGPAMVALVTDAMTRDPLTLHRTWIKQDGTKADVDPPRLLLGKHRKQGGVIRLWPDDAVTTSLTIAEGIETALTAAREIAPVWSAIDA